MLLNWIQKLINDDKKDITIEMLDHLVKNHLNFLVLSFLCSIFTGKTNRSLCFLTQQHTWTYSAIRLTFPKENRLAA